MLTTLSGVKIEAWHGDITRLDDVDVIVNAANVSLRGSGGVDGAIHRAAGGALLSACLAFPVSRVGDVHITPGFALRGRWVFHAVGPLWRGGEEGEVELLEACYRRCLLLAEEKQVSSIAFSAISCGANRFPPLAAMSIALGVVESFLQTPPQFLRRIVFVGFDDEVSLALKKLLVGIS